MDLNHLLGIPLKTVRTCLSCWWHRFPGDWVILCSLPILRLCLCQLVINNNILCSLLHETFLTDQGVDLCQTIRVVKDGAQNLDTVFSRMPLRRPPHCPACSSPSQPFLVTSAKLKPPQQAVIGESQTGSSHLSLSSWVLHSPFYISKFTYKCV